jgi:hypothetical protein
MNNPAKTQELPERIEKDTVILYDESRYGSKTLKKVEIHTIDGKKHTYEIKRTAKGKYLFN